MTTQGNAAMNIGRGRRLLQPSEMREQRKQPLSSMIVMCDGHEVSQRKFDHLKQHGPQKLRHRYVDCATKLRSAIPPEQWRLISQWIDANRPESASSRAQQDDVLIAILLAHAADRLQQNTGCLFDEIVEKRSAQMLLPSN